FTTVLNHGCTTIKDLDEPDTILLNGNSNKKIADSDIHDLISPINNVSLEEENGEELMHDDLQEPLDVFPDQSNEQDNQCTYDEMANAPSNKYPIVLIPSVNVELLNLKLQRSPSQINDSEDEIDDNSESSKKLFLKKSKKRKRKVSLNISRKKKEKTQIQHAETDSDNDESTSLDATIEELQIS
ncbi:13352_t:CDS:2, partial [Dentiscutata erythropus]